jgi:hypothetical protein
MYNLAGLISLFLIIAAFATSCGQPQQPKSDSSVKQISLRLD